MSSFATLRTSLTHSQQPSAAATKAIKSLFLQPQGSKSQRYLSTTTSSFATFAKPCSIITPASTIRYRQEAAPTTSAQQPTKRAFSLFTKNSSDTLAAAKAEEATRIPKAVQNDIPEVLLHETHPKPMLDEFMGKKRLTTKDLEAIPIDLQYHREPANVSDWVAYQTVKAMRIPTDIFFRTKYIHRVVALETVAAVVRFSLLLFLSLCFGTFLYVWFFRAVSPGCFSNLCASHANGRKKQPTSKQYKTLTSAHPPLSPSSHLLPCLPPSVIFSLALQLPKNSRAW